MRRESGASSGGLCLDREDRQSGCTTASKVCWRTWCRDWL